MSHRQDIATFDISSYICQNINGNLFVCLGHFGMFRQKKNIAAALINVVTFLQCIQKNKRKYIAKALIFKSFSSNGHILCIHNIGKNINDWREKKS